MALTDDSLDGAVARHYARQQVGLPPPCEPGYATLGEAIVAHRRWVAEHYPEPATRLSHCQTRRQ